MNEIIKSKYTEIEEAYGSEGSSFVRKTLSLFANARGDGPKLLDAWKELYYRNEVIVYDENIPREQYKGKIIVKRPLYNIKDLNYDISVCAGFLSENDELVFA